MSGPTMSGPTMSGPTVTGQPVAPGRQRRILPPARYRHPGDVIRLLVAGLVFASTAAATHGSALLAMNRVDGGPLDRMEPQLVTDSLLRGLWTEVTGLHRAKIALAVIVAIVGLVLATRPGRRLASGKLIPGLRSAGVSLRLAARGTRMGVLALAAAVGLRVTPHGLAFS
jgi:hypothetical protein